MTPGKAGLLVLVLLTAGLAGCIGSQGDDGLGSTDAGPISDDAIDLDITVPSGQDARDLIESYVMTHPFRSQNAAYEPYMQAARDDLATYLEELDGIDVVHHQYEDGVNILGIQEGATDPDQWVVLSAHYDTVDVGVGTTVYGAWDDGSGVAALMELADSLSTGSFPFTIVYAFFDGEEKGLRGSAAFVETYVEGGQADVLANINMDPPGLNWPCGDELGPFPVKIIHESAKVEDPDLPRYGWLHEAVEHGLSAAEVPDEVRDYTDGIPIATVAGTGVTGTSDHANFGAVDIANVFIGGIPTTIVGDSPDDHVVAGLTYPLHTPLDTLEAMEARCTQGSLADGLQTTVTTVSHTLMHMAKSGVPTGA